MMRQWLLSKSSINYDAPTIDIIRLARSDGVSPRLFFKLIKYFGSAKVALERISEFSIKGGRKKPIKIFSETETEKEIEKLNKINAAIVTYNDPRYSKLLLKTTYAPPFLIYKGNIKLLNKPGIAIVGSRNASMGALSFTKKIVKDLIHNPYVIISGLARGIDTVAHESSFPNTIAVLASGIDHIYPPQNKLLYEKISKEGLLVAELPFGTVPLAQYFPQRNRIIAGLAIATVVMEASLKSGSLITAKFALEYNREVFAVPGFPLDPRSHGANKLIKQGANIVESCEDILNNMPISDNIENLSDYDNKYHQITFMPNSYQNITESDRKKILNLLSSTPIEIELLLEHTGISLPSLYTILLELELAEKIVRHPGEKISLVYG